MDMGIAPVDSTVGATIDALVRDRLAEMQRADDYLRAASAGVLDTGRAGQIMSSESRVPKSHGIEQPAIVEKSTNSVGIEFKLLPAGEFTMGSDLAANEKPAHRVRLTKAVSIGIYPVTNAQYERLMGISAGGDTNGDHPKEHVTWLEAVAFCRKLSELPEERDAGRVYRLPTEAEWEYACRAGSNARFSFGDAESRLGQYGWFDKNSGMRTHPVGEKQPNAWGLYDMHGNVLEWCSDLYGDYQNGQVTNPRGPSTGSFRVARGGSYGSPAVECRSANRRGVIGCIGFRLALSLPARETPQVAEGR